MRFVVFDVETPNRANSRMSALGITVVEAGAIREDFFSLVNPEQPFDWFNTRLTGISAASVAGAPTFPALWAEVEPLMASGILVAHNASFDIGVLRRCLRDYGIAWKPTVQGLCTVIMGRSLYPGVSHRLNDRCAAYNIPLNHHRADSDSHACAALLLRYLADGAEAERYIRTYTLL